MIENKIVTDFKCQVCGEVFTLSSNSIIGLGDLVKCSKCKNFYVLKEETNVEEMGRTQHKRGEVK